MEFTLKDILFCALDLEKHASGIYNTASNEALNIDFKEELLSILDETHDAQYEIFLSAHEKGMYPCPLAEEKKIQETKAKFKKCCSDCDCNE